MSALQVVVAGRVGDFGVDVRFASDGGVTALFGQSGAGKTTVINMIGGLVRLVELLGIGRLLARRPRSLSGGEKQRVAIGRALLSEPAALVMDEPLASLDAPRKAEILPYLERLCRQARLPIVYVNHSIDEVVRLASTMVLLSGGRVAAVGPVAEVMTRLDLRR